MLWLLVAHAAGPADASRAALEALRAGLPRSEADLQASTDPTRWPGGWRVRVRPTLDGLPVDGASAVVALDAELRPLRITGRSPPPSAVPRGPVDRDAALEAADAVRERLGRGAIWPSRAEEVAWAGAGPPVHAWRVELSTADPPATWRAWIDAGDGALLDLQPTSRNVDGRVFPTSPVHGRTELVELEHLFGPSVLRGTYADASSCRSADVAGGLFGVSTCESLGRLAFPVNGDFPWSPAPGELHDPFSEVNLYHHVTRAAAWFDGRYGLRDAEPLQVIANFPMANAFYGDFTGDGRGDLAFGTVCDGCGEPGPSTRVQFGYDADVVVHELAHWVVGRIADIPMLGGDRYGLEWAGGSLNEGAADVFAMAMTGDPAVGEYAGLAFGDGPIRELSADRRCPDDLRGQVHLDGEILGSLGWDLIGALGPERTSDLLFGAVATWGPDISWAVAGQSLLDAADDLLAAGVLDAEAHGRAVERIGASGMPGCGRVIPLDDGRTPDPFILSAGLEGPLERIPGGTQFSVELPPSPERLVVEVRDLRGPEGLAWSIFARCGEPVENEPTNLAAFGLGFAVPTAWDWTIDGDGPSGRLVVDAASDPPLPAEGTCYVAVAGRDAGPLEPLAFTLGRLTLHARAERAVPPSSGGCDTAPGAGLWLGLLAWRSARRRVGVPGGRPAG